MISCTELSGVLLVFVFCIGLQIIPISSIAAGKKASVQIHLGLHLASNNELQAS